MPGGPSATTSRHWRSTGRSATATAKASPWATWGAPTDNWEIPSGDQLPRAGAGDHREIGDRRSEGNVLGNLGSCLPATGGRPAGHQLLRAGAGDPREIGDRHGEGTVLGNLGSAYLATGGRPAGRRLLRAGAGDRGRSATWTTWQRRASTWPCSTIGKASQPRLCPWPAKRLPFKSSGRTAIAQPAQQLVAQLESKDEPSEATLPTSASPTTARSATAAARVYALVSLGTASRALGESPSGLSTTAN